MKTLYIISFCLLLLGKHYCYSQQQIIKKGTYVFTKSLPVETNDQLLVGPTTQYESINEGHKVTFLYEKDNKIYFRYWNFTKNDALKKQYNNGHIFSIDKEKFLQISSPLYSKYKGATVGAYSVPFRLRDIGGDHFDFESSLSLQANLVFGFGSQLKETSWFDTSIGIGVTGVSLNSKNSLVTEDRTASALTLSLGAVFKPSKFANLGIFLGWDFLGQKDREIKWKYDGQAWLGLGINITLNELKTDVTMSEKSNK